MSEQEGTVFFCRCHTHILRVEQDDALPNDFYLSMYESSGYGPMSWKERIRHVWRVLRTGYPFNDCLILSNKDGKDFARTLLGGVR